jgi:hypothetical protein
MGYGGYGQAMAFKPASTRCPVLKLYGNKFEFGVDF